MRRRLLLLGASGFAREVLWMADDIAAAAREWDVAGFLDDDRDGARASLAAMGVDLPVLGTIRDHVPGSDEVFLPAIGSNRARLAIGSSLLDRGAAFITLVHPTARVHRSASIGTGVVIGPLACVAPKAAVGQFSVLNPSASLREDVVVGEGSFVGARCELMSGAVLERGTFLGSHVTVHPHVRVAAFATIGVGSVVLRRVAAGSTQLGVPARPLAV
ncbi:MAG: acetyltransferase [Gemmatimonadaceae bacterium]|nr:acetyltransferase [Gemmatimonadaceae bacterium]